MLIFPEGTRTADGKLQAFKKGGFVLAIQAGMPVVPLCVCGTYDVVVKGGRKVLAFLRCSISGSLCMHARC